jgi:hypothetical protein
VDLPARALARAGSFFLALAWPWGSAVIAPTPCRAAPPLEQAVVGRTDGSRSLGNGFLTLTFALGNDGPRLRELENKFSGRKIPIAADDFHIEVDGRPPLCAADFRFVRDTDEIMPGGRRLRFQFEGPTPSLGLEVSYELGDRDFFARRSLSLTATHPLPLREVDAWRLGIAGTCSSQESGVPHYMNDPGWLYTAEHKGFGVPVFLEDTFWGLEYPGGFNRFTNDTLTLTHFPGRTITNRFVSKSAVLGVAERGAVPRRFREYVRTFQATPGNLGLFVNYNTWVTLMPPTEAGCVQILDLFRKKLAEPYGVALDSFTLDDGWDDKNSLWKIRSSGFPNGFEPLRKALPAGTRLGLWISPSSGYDHSGWLGRNGYKPNANPRWMCQSDSTYARDMTKVTTDLVKDHDLAFLKLDTWAATCDAPGHEHLPGNFAKEASIDAFLDYLAAIRKVQPRIFLDPTCGVWLSPWFLQQADALWGEVWDGIPPGVVPSLNDIEGACSSRDYLFRKRCEETPSFPPEAMEHLGIYEYMAADPNAVMSTLGRGCHLLTFYVDVRKFSDADWAFIAHALKWARANAQTLTGHTYFIPGDPLKREPYGYAHFAGQRGIVSLRNPFIQPRTASFTLDAATGVSSGGTFVGRIVYPRHETLPHVLRYGDSVNVKLDGYETAILQFDPAGSGPLLLGARAPDPERGERRLVYRVSGPAGSGLAATLVNGAGLTNATFDGRAVAYTNGRLSVAFAGEPQACRVEGESLSVQATQLVGRCVVHVPAGSKAALHLLVDKTGREARTVAAMDGRNIAVNIARAPAVRRLPRPVQELPQGMWSFYTIDVPEGRHEILVALDFPGEVRPEAGWWLRAEHKLAQGDLALDFRDPLPPPAAPPALPATRDSSWLETIVLQAPSALPPTPP